jgi:hypothetical protein
VSGTGSPQRSQNVLAPPLKSARSLSTGRSQLQSEADCTGCGVGTTPWPFWDGLTVTL